MKESKIPKFRRCVLQNFPFIEEDFDALTDYELLCKVVQYLNLVIDNVNDVVEKTDGLIASFEQLKSYVDNYFDNLDVQEEINNKLEEMAEGGELAGIIAQFLEMAPVFGYNTISAMASATNLSNGCIARVLGNTVAANGDGAFYMIRTITGADDPDGVNLVAIGDTLVGVRVTDAAINDLQDQIDDLVQPPKKYLFVGDSYADGYTPDGNVTPWESIVKTKLGLSDAQFVTTHQGGFGFARPAQYNYYTLISALDNDSDITDIIIGGGYNDANYSYADISSGINNVVTLCASKFPNAKVHIAFIGWTSDTDTKSSLIYTFHNYNSACNNLPQVDFMVNTQYALHDYFTMFSSDGIHPNTSGQNSIANAIYDALIYGQANISLVQSFAFDPVDDGVISGNSRFNTFVNNEITTLWNSNQMIITWTADNYPVLSGGNVLKIGTITSGCMVGTSGDGCSTNVTLVAQIDTETSTAPHDGAYVSIPVEVLIRGGDVYLNGKLINAAGSNYGSYTIKQLQFPTFSITTNTILA